MPTDLTIKETQITSIRDQTILTPKITVTIQIRIHVTVKIQQGETPMQIQTVVLDLIIAPQEVAVIQEVLIKIIQQTGVPTVIQETTVVLDTELHLEVKPIHIKNQQRLQKIIRITLQNPLQELQVLAIIKALAQAVVHPVTAHQKGALVAQVIAHQEEVLAEVTVHQAEVQVEATVQVLQEAALHQDHQEEDKY